MKNIAFFLQEGDENWNGGINYFNNLFSILQNSKKYNIFVFTSKKSAKVLKNKLNDGVEIIEQQFLTSGTISYYIWKFVFYYFHYSLFVDNLVKKYKIHLVSHSCRIPMNVKSKIKSCPWIPDLQFLHYPEYFNNITNKRLPYIFKFLGKSASILLFSSNDSMEDYCKLDPNIDKNKLYVLHFVVRPKNTIEESDRQVLEKYHLQEYKYYIVTNQFWKHKNHDIVIEAIKKLKESKGNIPYKIVFTGLLKDLRDPNRSMDIIKKIKAYDIENEIIITDSIPYKDVLALQHFSLSVIQPSLFEGWNTAVEECKNVGKKIILSNIKVHLEQNPDNVVFFNPHDASELASIIDSVYNNFNLESELDYYRQAIKKQDINWKKFSDEYLSLIHDILL